MIIFQKLLFTLYDCITDAQISCNVIGQNNIGFDVKLQNLEQQRKYLLVLSKVISGVSKSNGTNASSPFPYTQVVRCASVWQIERKLKRLVDFDMHFETIMYSP